MEVQWVTQTRRELGRCFHHRLQGPATFPPSSASLSLPIWLSCAAPSLRFAGVLNAGLNAGLAVFLRRCREAAEWSSQGSVGFGVRQTWVQS